MKAIEFNEIENAFFLIEEKTKAMCVKNRLDYFEYASVFYKFLNKYILLIDKKRVIESLDFSDKISVRAILNKRNFSSKQNEINNCETEFLSVRKSLFEILDTLEDPYFFILNPVFDYGAGIDYNSWFCNRFGYKKRRNTGIENLYIAEDYALYKIANKIYENKDL